MLAISCALTKRRVLLGHILDSEFSRKHTPQPPRPDSCYQDSCVQLREGLYSVTVHLPRTLSLTISWDSASGAAPAASAASRTGCRRLTLTSFSTSSVIVALNSIVCRARGASRTISCTCATAEQPKIRSICCTDSVGNQTQHMPSLALDALQRQLTDAVCTGSAIMVGPVGRGSFPLALL